MQFQFIQNNAALTLLREQKVFSVVFGRIILWSSLGEAGRFADFGDVVETALLRVGG